MEQHDQERSWKSDPRLHHMDAKKIALLASFADELAAAPEAQRMNLFLDLHRKMRNRAGDNAGGGFEGVIGIR